MESNRLPRPGSPHRHAVIAGGGGALARPREGGEPLPSARRSAPAPPADQRWRPLPMSAPEPAPATPTIVLVGHGMVGARYSPSRARPKLHQTPPGGVVLVVAP
ncbi:hypothetical protein ACFXEZ_26165, partial [Streptomyces hygroscopicus]